MKPTDWQNTAKFVQEVQKNATLADSNQLSSLPLSELSLDSSGPPTVLKGAIAPLSTSTLVCMQQDNQVGADDTPDNQPFQPIIPGISNASLYPGWFADNIHFFELIQSGWVIFISHCQVQYVSCMPQNIMISMRGYN